MKKILFKFILYSLFTNSAYGYDFCSSLEGVKDEATYKKKLSALISEQNKSLKGLNNRHKVARKLNNCTPHKNSKGLFLVFAGTGAFNPRTFDIMSKAIKCKHLRQMPEKLQKKTYTLAKNMLAAKGSSYTKWSTIEMGPMTRMIMSKPLKSKMAMYNFAIYPSEESKLLISEANLTIENIRKIPEEMKRSVKGKPIGIKNALNCTDIYLNGMKAKGKTPKIILMSHSSGGRSVVKFLESLKQRTTSDVDLVLTIDPVKEAHHAVEEVLPQVAHRYLEQGAAWILDVDVPQRVAAVWSRKQPKVLYKTSNSKRWINFYQLVDTRGLKGPVKFGIKGSPIHKADHNHYIKEGLGASGHGEIGYNARVKDIIEDEILDL